MRKVKHVLKSLQDGAGVGVLKNLRSLDNKELDGNDRNCGQRVRHLKLKLVMSGR
jgi:hypothetical protein